MDERKQRLFVPFLNPADGGPPFSKEELSRPNLWKREGETFEDLSLHPSIDASGIGHWHGFIKGGNITPLKRGR